MRIKHFLSATALLLPLLLTAQKSVVPEVKVVNERNANPMVLQDLSVDILVVGQTAVTTMEMTFYNPNTRVMEGEFQFPLADGQQVSRFALDINGKLREGVVVDKALGRKAFEDIVRRGVDPGLLEKTEGNNFKARVYPMPAKGTRRVLIAFEQELHERGGQDYYFLPITANVTLKNFKVRTEVVSRFVKADIQNSLQLDFKQARNSYISEVSKQNFTLNQNIALTFPKIEKPQTISATQGSKSYFYGNIALSDTKAKSSPIPKEIGLLWDASHSAIQRDRTKEFAFLDAYFKELKDTKVVLSTFNIRSAKPLTFEVKNGNWQALKSHLESLQYDGATDGNAIDFNLKTDEILLFSDGIFNFGSKEFSVNEVVKQAKTPVSVVNASAVANTPKMQYLANATGGSFIDLTTLTTEQAIKVARTVPFQLLDIEVKSGKVTKIFPQKGATISKGNFTLAGELQSEEATLVLSFGYPKKVMVQKEIKFVANPDASESEFNLLRRIWAEKQIAQLQREGVEQKQIDAVGRDYGIVTEGNSLIVLETVEDYVRYRITPPTELQQEYSKRLANEQKQKEDSAKRILENVIAQSAEQSKWWNTQYPLKDSKSKNKAVIMEEVVYTIDNNAIADVAAVEAPSMERSASKEVSSNAMAKRATAPRSTPAPASVPTSKIELNAYNPDTPYLKVMEYTEEAKAVETYYKLKKEYGNTPSFYVDVADYFFKKGNREQAILVVSNLAELGLDDPQLLRMLGYKLSNYNAKKETVWVFRKVVTLREEEPQSFRDLGLALADDGAYNEAVKNLYKVVTSEWSSRFGDVQIVTMNDINSLVARHKGIDVSYIDKRLLKKEPVDVRVVLSWDTDSCDMDLWVTDPKDEKCYYQNTLTYLGGKISRDVTQGYGPEEFMLKKAEKGKYKVQVDYFGTRSQKQLMPVNLRITFYTHYGTPQQKQQETTVRLSNAKEVIEVGSFEF
ncbi:VIT domain-containing protein [Capnocytophaga ochracea]|jgi:vault protein inter-alpha-trypsin, metazoa|uniref:VIT domain-containing protein n=1 Tax=Capnocytophaga ochracea TaxID=1018 RepID=UPI002B4988DB|nr:VIT domain-containing protein [Capnocytophaga ochracea]MEB3036302.1 VIT domain-containing protein [Capnocytophaga ochracea]